MMMVDVLKPFGLSVLGFSVVVCLFIPACTSNSNDSPKGKTDATWPIAKLSNGGFESPRLTIVVTGPTRFLCNGIKCRLLGLKDPGDIDQQKEAMLISRRWMEDCDSRIMFLNSDDPLVIDGECIVWVRQNGGLSEDLNVLLLERRLVDLDIEKYSAYVMTERAKDGSEVIVDWGKILLDVARD